MTVYKGSQKNKDVYLGKTKIGKIYKGSQLLYTSLAYPLDTIVFEKTTAGTYNIALEKGKYEVYCIAGGGGGWGYKSPSARASGGGSGSGFIGQISISKGSYEIIVGSGGSSGSNSGGSGGSSALGNIVKTFGGSGSGNYPAGGAAPNVTASIISTTLNKAGNGGSHKSGSLSSASAAGGASVYKPVPDDFKLLMQKVVDGK